MPRGHLVSTAVRRRRDLRVTCFDSQCFVSTIPQFFKVKQKQIYIYIYMLAAGLQGWNHVSPDRPITAPSCEVETAGPGLPGASRGAGSGWVGHRFPSRPADSAPRQVTHSGGRAGLWVVLVTRPAGSPSTPQSDSRRTETLKVHSQSIGTNNDL